LPPRNDVLHLQLPTLCDAFSSVEKASQSALDGGHTAWRPTAEAAASPLERASDQRCGGERTEEGRLGLVPGHSSSCRRPLRLTLLWLWLRRVRCGRGGQRRLRHPRLCHKVWHHFCSRGPSDASESGRSEPTTLPPTTLDTLRPSFTKFYHAPFGRSDCPGLIFSSRWPGPARRLSDGAGGDAICRHTSVVAVRQSMIPGVQPRHPSGRGERRDLTRQHTFGVEREASIARGEHWRELPPAVAAADACEQTFALLTSALRYHCLPCWDAFRALDEDAECAVADPCRRRPQLAICIDTTRIPNPRGRRSIQRNRGSDRAAGQPI
jgi:hypothetical protein